MAFDFKYSGFPRIRNHFFGYSLLFLNNSLLFYQLFHMKIEICFSYKGGSTYASEYHKNAIDLNILLTGSKWDKTHNLFHSA